MKAFCTPNIQSYIAGEALTTQQYHFVKFGTVEGEVIAISSASDKPCGVLMNAPDHNEAAEVAMLGGGALLKCDGGISAGDEITTGADGHGELLSGATDAFVAARADAMSSTDTSSGDVIPVIVMDSHYNVDESDVITTVGDITQGGAGGVAERLAIGATAGMVLTSGGTGQKSAWSLVNAASCGVTAGTVAASKPIVLGADGKLDTLDLTAVKIGGTSVTATAAEVNKLAGCTSTAAELSLTDNETASVAMTIASGASNIAEVTLTLKDAAGSTITASRTMLLWLSAASTGAGLHGTAASGTVQAKSASGTDFGALTAKKALIVQTKTDGTYILEITDTQKTTFYVCAKPFGSAQASVSAQLQTASYGA